MTHDDLRAAYEAGHRARVEGRLARENPHDDWELGVSWATGWHARREMTVTMLEQAKMLPAVLRDEARP